MIVVDTSALIAVIQAEPGAVLCQEVLRDASDILMCAATLVEVGIVAARRSASRELQLLLTELEPEVVPVTETRAERAVQAYRRYGKGFHPARLNFGDCFAYELAKSRGCPLLYVGEDFAQTDVRAAITASP